MMHASRCRRGRLWPTTNPQSSSQANVCWFVAVNKLNYVGSKSFAGFATANVRPARCITMSKIALWLLATIGLISVEVGTNCRMRNSHPSTGICMPQKQASARMAGSIMLSPSSPAYYSSSTVAMSPVPAMATKARNFICGT
jgi:hypothetical protein